MRQHGGGGGGWNINAKGFPTRNHSIAPRPRRTISSPKGGVARQKDIPLEASYRSLAAQPLGEESEQVLKHLHTPLAAPRAGLPPLRVPSARAPAPSPAEFLCVPKICSPETATALGATVSYAETQLGAPGSPRKARGSRAPGPSGRASA